MHVIVCSAFAVVVTRAVQVLRNRSSMDEDHITRLEQKCKEAELFATETQKKYDEVCFGGNLVCMHLVVDTIFSPLTEPRKH